jgi:hypothetical protein
MKSLAMSKMKPSGKFLKACLVFPPVWICTYIFLVYHSLDLFVRTGYGNEALSRLNMIISGQRALLGVVLHGQPKEQVIASVKSVLDRPEHRKMKLETFDKYIAFGETTIYFENSKATFVYERFR